MSSFVNEAYRTFTAGAALAAHRRVKLSTGKLAYAGVGDLDIGVLQTQTYADGDAATVRLRNLEGTVKMTAAGAFSAGATLYGAANGKVDDTVTLSQVGIALEAATADGDIVEVLPMSQVDGAVSGVASGYRIARGETALDGSNPTPVTTGLTTCIAFVATLKGTAAPGDNTSVLTADISGGDANVYAWKNTGGTDPTLVASTGTESFYWIAVGT